MSSVSTRWILAYDLHCGGCSALAERVAERSGARIEIADLSNSEVQRLRSVAFEGRPLGHPPCCRSDRPGSMHGAEWD